MAGDLDLAEALFGPPAAGGHWAGAAGPLLHEYGPNVRIGLGAQGGPPGAPINEDALSLPERLGLKAFRSRLSDGYKSAKAKRPHQAAPWGGGAGAPELHADRQFVIRGAPVEADPAEAPEAKRLSGRVAVGLIIVSGPGQLAMGDAHQRKVVAEVQNGLSYLGGQAPAKDVTFTYDIQVAQIGLADTTGQPPAGADVNEQYEFYEQPWRDAALQALGYPAGGNGIRQYIRRIKADKGAQSAYCAFFTLYKLHHFAYCSGSYLTMHYDNDGWGTDNLDRVFAHETGHVFGAPDEYAESGCNCRGSWGFYGKPNLNCESCATDGGVDCLMRRNTWEMCAQTPYHLGYRMEGA